VAAITLHNVTARNEVLESEHLQIRKRYKPEDEEAFSKLLGVLIILLDSEPRDILGQLYMSLELENTQTGQFFTPPEISELMARLMYGDMLKNLEKPFITLAEPACGAGGMVLAFVNVMISHGHDPACKLWVQCQDIDRTAALMCYLQMALWNIPGVVIVGNTIAAEVREVFYTPAHYLWGWNHRLRAWENTNTQAQEIPREEPAPEPVAAHRAPSSLGPQQFDFGF
jgi:type I restriction-modification system DNA methylase subunit